MFFINPFYYVPNDLLVFLYQEAVRNNFNERYIQMVFKEIKHRNLRVDKKSKAHLSLVK